MINLNDPVSLQLLIDTIQIDVDESSKELFQDGHRKHLGASQIGEPCSRKLWYAFRWVKKPQFPGRILRLFNRGHREEHALIKVLLEAGWKLNTTPEKQDKLSDVGGHFGGSMDNSGRMPDRYSIDKEFLIEFKTAKNTLFNRLKKNGVKREYAKHWSQMCIYGYKKGLEWAIYVSVNKDTDELHFEVLQLDWEHAKAMIDKAALIITAKEAPPQIARSITHYDCKYCDYKDICHNGEKPEKNCRSCIHATAVDGKLWACGKAEDTVIPEHVISVGCPQWEPVR